MITISSPLLTKLIKIPQGGGKSIRCLKESLLDWMIYITFVASYKILDIALFIFYMFTAIYRALCISFITKGKCAFNVCPQYLIFLSLRALVMFWLEKNTTLSHKLWKKYSEFISFFGPDIYCQLFHSPFPPSRNGMWWIYQINEK